MKKSCHQIGLVPLPGGLSLLAGCSGTPVLASRAGKVARKDADILVLPLIQPVTDQYLSRRPPRFLIRMNGH